MSIRRKTQKRLKKYLQGFFVIALSTAFVAAAPAVGFAAVSTGENSGYSDNTTGGTNLESHIGPISVGGSSSGYSEGTSNNTTGESSSSSHIGPFGFSGSSSGYSEGTSSGQSGNSEDDYNNKAHTTTLTEGESGSGITIGESSGETTGWANDNVFRELLNSGEFAGKGFGYIAQRILDADVDGTLSESERNMLQNAVAGDPSSIAMMAGQLGDYEFFQSVATDDEKAKVQYAIDNSSYSYSTGESSNVSGHISVAETNNIGHSYGFSEGTSYSGEHSNDIIPAGESHAYSDYDGKNASHMAKSEDGRYGYSVGSSYGVSYSGAPVTVGESNTSRGSTAQPTNETVGDSIFSSSSNVSIGISHGESRGNDSLQNASNANSSPNVSRGESNGFSFGTVAKAAAGVGVVYVGAKGVSRLMRREDEADFSEDSKIDTKI